MNMLVDSHQHFWKVLRGDYPWMPPANDAWILGAKVIRNLEILASGDFSIDSLIHPRHLPYIIQLLQRFPRLRVVIDHAAKPQIHEGLLHPWKEHMEGISSYENVMCKLSSLITQTGPLQWRTTDFSPYVHHLIEAFGVKSVMFGSDWPYCLLAGGYSDVLELMRTALPDTLSEEDLTAVFGGNAMRFYRLI